MTPDPNITLNLKGDKLAKLRFPCRRLSFSVVVLSTIISFFLTMPLKMKCEECWENGKVVRRLGYILIRVLLKKKKKLF